MGVLRDLLRHWPRRIFAPAAHLRAKYEDFKGLLDADEKSQVLLAELEEILYAGRPADPARVPWLCQRLLATVQAMAQRLEAMQPGRYQGLAPVLERLGAELAPLLEAPPPPTGPPYLLPLAQCLGRPEQAGGKAANLACAARLGLAVPPAVAVSARAFSLFIETNALRPRLDRLLRQVDLERPERLAAQCEDLRELVLDARLPPPLAEALDRVAALPGFAGASLAVRSSAVGEDGGLSYAGQYASELSVDPAHLRGAWRRVAAAKYRPRAVAYRILNGLGDEDVPMAVLVMPMVDAVCAGALFSRDLGPDGEGGEPAVSVFALAGLGDRLMAGRVAPRSLRLSRSERPEVLEDAGPRGPELAPETLAGLVRAAVLLEERFGCPQEVEWAVDREGRVLVLQSRPHLAREESSGRGVEAGGGCGLQPLAVGLRRVSGGLGAGVLHRLDARADAAGVPHGAVVLAGHLSPSLARCVGRASAVLASCGSRASHFASVAREFGLPVLVGAEEELRGLEHGRLITVDADAGAVFDGACPLEPGRAGTPAAEPAAEPDAEPAADSASGPDAPAGQAAGAPAGQAAARLRQRFGPLAPLVCRLGLTDPESPEFSPRGCRSLHDVVRYCHEKAVAEMFSLAGTGGRGLGGARRLQSPLPLSMFLLDLGGGLASGGTGADVRPEDFASVPMQAFWSGLAHAGETWDASLPHCDWEEFDRVSAGIFRPGGRLLASYALCSEDYLHLLVRFGYHFAVLDSLCAERPEANYVGLRFKGGGGMEERKLLRLLFISRVLAGAGFTVRTRGDMLDARYARAGQEATCRRLAILGRLLARTRLMDLRLADAAQAEREALAFLSEVHHAR